MFCVLSLNPFFFNVSQKKRATAFLIDENTKKDKYGG